jgi:prevent-host-death family protein
MITVGLRELRQQASELVRRVDSGEEVTITVSGRPAARLVPVEQRKTWRSFAEIAELFELPEDPDWESDRRLLDDVLDSDLDDPWNPR